MLPHIFLLKLPIFSLVKLPIFSGGVGGHRLRQAFMKKQFGNSFRAWRHALDLDGSMNLQRAELFKAGTLEVIVPFKRLKGIPQNGGLMMVNNG